jgi:hypothetical protein
MIRDERIQSSKRRIASQTFGLWYILLLATLLYRQFYLRQSLDQYWDIAAIFFCGTLYTSIALFARGAVYESMATRSLKWAAPIILVSIVITAYFLGNIKSIGDLVETILGAALGLAVINFLFFVLYRRWEKRIDIG